MSDNGSASESGGATHWPALVYHDVVPATRASGGGPDRFSVPVAMFERMLDAIRLDGFIGCSLAAAIASPCRRRVAITFDDATLGQFEYAMPALRARGMTATVYVVTEWIGRPGFMTWDQLRRIVDWGMSVQSHTRSHPFLSELDVTHLRAELTESKERIDRELRQGTTEVAFPGGDAPRRALRNVLWEAGYRVAVGTRWGRNADGAQPGHFIQRCTVRGDISAAEAKRYVNGDRWLAMRMFPREMVLRSLRASLGPSRYARWRRRFLDARS